jgi:hypothetical protein
MCANTSGRSLSPDGADHARITERVGFGRRGPSRRPLRIRLSPWGQVPL